MLTGFNGPQGECSDKRGNVWVTNTYAFQILKFSHTGTLLKTLADPDGYPVGCAIDPTTGNLAVTNIRNFSGFGEVLVFSHASGTPTIYQDQYGYPRLEYYYFDGYDPKGNLFVDGNTDSHVFVLAELPKDGNAFTNISISGDTIYFPGMVQWWASGDYLAVGDQGCGNHPYSCVYHVSIAGSTGTTTGVTAIKSYANYYICDMVQGVLDSSSGNLVGGDYETCNWFAQVSSVNRWLFPAGGQPKSYYIKQGSAPFGAAISE
jgi:DNA-binding beta-propeller fold protein YncE